MGTCLLILHDTLGMKSSIFVGLPMPWTRIKRPKELLYHMEFFRYYRAFVALVSKASSLEMNYGSLCILPVIRHGCRHEVNSQEQPVKGHTENQVISLLWSVNGTRSLVDVPKISTYNSAFFCDTVIPNLFDIITLHSWRKSLKDI
jgi:hypothetical protein